MFPQPAPFLTLPTFSKGKVRDISLTDFKGSYLIVFFFPSDFENDEDLVSLHENLKLIKKHACDVIACSTDSTMMHSKWVQQLNNEGKNDSFTIPLMSDKIGSLSKSFAVFDEEEGICQRSILLVDEKSVCREMIISSLSMSEIIPNIVETLKSFKNLKLEDIPADNSGMFDRFWRTTLKMADTPRRRMQRSTSRAKSPDTKRSRSKSLQMKPEPENGPCDKFSENIISSLKCVMSSLYGEAELPPLTAGEIKLQFGKVSGLWKLVKGGNAELMQSSSEVKLSFPLLLRGVACAYDFGGRRLKGEINCNYEKIIFQISVSQKIASECFTNSVIVENVKLDDVKGVRMNVSGFGPLNWIAAKSVTNIIQENVLQAVEDQLRAGLHIALNNSSFYFQMNQEESYKLCPAGILVC